MKIYPKYTDPEAKKILLEKRIKRVTKIVALLFAAGSTFLFFFKLLYF